MSSVKKWKKKLKVKPTPTKGPALWKRVAKNLDSQTKNTGGNVLDGNNNNWIPPKKG